MEEIKTTLVPMFYIEYYKHNTEKLTDISEKGYTTIKLCQAAIAEKEKENDKFKQELLEQYEEEMKLFVLDLDTSDTEPLYPLTLTYRYDMKPGLYVFGENGHVAVTQRAIDNLDSLRATPEQIETLNNILNGTSNPETFYTVKKWIAQCYNKPSSDELKMAAINEALVGYGIESVRTSKWKNGHWCDILCTYVNMGDSYIPTIIHHRKHGFMVSSIEDIIEKNKHVI